MDFFQLLDSAVPIKKQSSRLNDPFLHKGRNPKLFFIIPSHNKGLISIIKDSLRRVFKTNIPEFSVIYPFRYIMEESEFSKQISHHVYNSVIDFKEYIPPGSKIIPMGRALYTLTKEATFNTFTFYALDHVKSYFYHPDLDSHVFPIDDAYYFRNFSEKRFLNNFNYYFMLKQIQKAYNLRPEEKKIPTPRLMAVEDPNSFLLANKDKYDSVAWDLETSGLTFYKDDVICITMSFDGRRGYYLDFEKIDLKILDDFFEDKYQIGANLKFDVKFLRYLGLKNVKIDFDTLNAGHLLNEMASNALSSHGWRFTDLGGHEIELQKYLFNHPRVKSYANIPRSILSTYASMDAVVTYHVYKSQLKELEEDPGLYRYYFEEMIPNLNMFTDIELAGVPIDWDYLGELLSELEGQRDVIEKDVFRLVGREFNIVSQKELSKILKDELGFKDHGFIGKDGSYLTNEEAMSHWVKDGHEVAQRILDYRSINTQITTFVGSEEDESAYWKFRSKDNKVHPSYQVMLTQSHRNKCSSPNFQQIPKRSSHAKMIRKMFKTPSDEYLFFEGDYAGFQMRIAAVFSGDKNLIEAFTKYGGDVHSMTALAIFHREWTLEEFIKVKHQKPYKEQRDIAKGVNFSFLFGAASKAFTDSVLRVEWTEEYCQQFIIDLGISVQLGEDNYDAAGRYIRDSFFNKYPGLKDWHDKSHETAKKTGRIISAHGARRLLPQLKYLGGDSDGKLTSNLLNISKNSPVQDFEAVAIMRAMRGIHDFFKDNNMKSFIFGMIHDAVQFYVHRDEVAMAVPKIFELFEKDYPEYLGIPMAFELNVADPLLGEIWGFGREMNSENYHKILFQ